jgi:hypothetical protein
MRTKLLHSSFMLALAMVLFGVSCERHSAQEWHGRPFHEYTTPSSKAEMPPHRSKPNTTLATNSKANSTMNDPFLLTVLSAILAWLVSTASINVYRFIRMRAALLEDVRTQVSTTGEAIRDLATLTEQHVCVGKTLDQSGHYIITEYELFNALQTELFAYFPACLSRITKFYRHLQEMDILMKRLYDELTGYKDFRKPLTKEDVDYLNGKFLRIAAMAKALPKPPILSLRQLPIDYGRQLTVDKMREFIGAILQPAIGSSESKRLPESGASV